MAGQTGREPRPLLGIDRGGWLIFFAQGLSGLAQGPFIVFGAIYQRQLHATPVEIGIVAALGSVVGTLSMLPGIRLAESYHLRPTLLAGWLLAIPAPVCYALAPDWRLTALGAFFLGVAVCNTPAMNVYLTLGVPKDRLAMVMTTVLSSFSLGLIGATLLDGWAAQVMGIRWLFGTSVLLFSLASVCVAFVPRKPLPAETAVRLRYRHLSKFPAFVTLLVLFAALTVVVFIPWTFLPLYLEEVGRMNNLGVGALVGILFLGSVLAGACLSTARRRFGSLPVVLLFELLFVVSAGVLLGARAFPSLAVACFLRGGFWSFRQVMTAVIGESLPFAALPKGYGVFAVVTGLAAALAYPIGGWLYGNGMAIPFSASAILMLIGMLATFAVRAAFREPVRPAMAPLVDRVLPEAA